MWNRLDSMRGAGSIVRRAICNQSINMNKFGDISRLTSAVQVQTIVVGEKIKNYHRKTSEG
jgi:hypothetical protein